MLAFKMAAATLLLALALNGCAAENDKHGHPQLGFYQAPGGNNCPRGDEIFTQADCQAAAKQLVHTFAKPVNDIKGRPHGCFWDKVGGVYFNKAKCCYKGGWGGVGGMCKRQGTPLEAAGEMVSKPGDKYSTKGGGASFDNTIWITQTLAKSRADLFYPGDGKKCPIGLGIWLHKEYDGSEDLAGPFVVKACNMNDAGLYSVTFTQAPKFPGNSDRHRLDFKVKDWIYLRSKDGKPASTMAPRTSSACARVDVTFVNDEIAMLRYRWALHKGLFDKQFVFEAAETFMGNPKAPHVTNTIPQDEVDENRAEVVLLPSMEHLKGTRFAIEEKTRDYAWKHVSHDPCVNEHTLIYMADVDELLDEERAARVFGSMKDRSQCIAVTLLLTEYNERCYYPKLRWQYPVAGYPKSSMRHCHRHCLNTCLSVNKTFLGWHMSNHLPVPTLERKLHAFSHAHDAFVERVLRGNATKLIRQRAHQCTDLYGRERERPELIMERFSEDFGGFTPRVAGWPRMTDDGM